MARERKGGFIEGHDESIGRSDFAGMPKEVVMREYPKTRGMKDEMIDDTMSDIDGIENESEGKRRRYLSNQK